MKPSEQLIVQVGILKDGRILLLMAVGIIIKFAGKVLLLNLSMKQAKEMNVK